MDAGAATIREAEATEVRLRPVQRALADNADAIGELAELVGQLEHRLADVLSPDHGAYGRPQDDGEDRPSRSSVTATLEGQTSHARDVADRVRTLIDALEV